MCMHVWEVCAVECCQLVVYIFSCQLPFFLLECLSEWLESSVCVCVCVCVCMCVCVCVCVLVHASVSYEGSLGQASFQGALFDLIWFFFYLFASVATIMAELVQMTWNTSLYVFGFLIPYFSFVPRQPIYDRL
jgi:hypothetical protein